MNRFILNPMVISQLKQEAFMGAEMLERAKRMESVAKSIAPVKTGTYRNSIHTQLTLESGSVIARLIADAEHAIPIEVGTRDTPTFAVLRRAAETVGGTTSMRR